MLWALKDAPVVDVHERMVLVALAERADPDGCGAYPSKNTIAAQACVDPKTVQRTLGRLLQRGLIALGDQAEASRIPAR
jgi:DNA-binding MarR family transcriptional regulator